MNKREIKFRAWRPDLRRHIYQIEYLSLAEKTGSIIEQYTGRTDQHRMELYEGDIIEFRFRTKHDNELYTGKIYFDDFMYLVESFSGEVFSLNRINSVTLLGNIHEHPHLLKSE